MKIPTWLYLLWDIAKLVIIAFLLVTLAHYFIFQPFLVDGPSMEPSFETNDYLIIEEVTRYFRPFQRGDVVIFHPPHEPDDYLIKRIVGLPKERLVVDSGDIFIYNNVFKNGIKLKEEYLAPGTRTTGDIDILLEEDEYYVMGDSRNISLDSRSFGPVKKEAVTGRAWLRGWPLNKFSIFSTPVYSY